MKSVKLALACLGITFFSFQAKAESPWDSQDLAKLPTTKQGQHAAIFEVKHVIEANPADLSLHLQEGNTYPQGSEESEYLRKTDYCTLILKHRIEIKPSARHLDYKPTFLNFEYVKRFLSFDDGFKKLHHYELKIADSKLFDKLKCYPAHEKSEPSINIGEFRQIINGPDFQITVPAS